MYDRRAYTAERTVQLADPAKDRLKAALLDSKSLLQTARGLVPLGFEGEEELVRVSGTVADLADSLYKDLEEKFVATRNKSGGVKRRLTDA